jgi:hypothetical protein
VQHKVCSGKEQYTYELQNPSTGCSAVAQAELTGNLSKMTEEREFLRSLNETLLSNQKEFNTQLAAAQAELKDKDAQLQDLQEQVGKGVECIGLCGGLYMCNALQSCSTYVWIMALVVDNATHYMMGNLFGCQPKHPMGVRRPVAGRSSVHVTHGVPVCL